MATLPQPPEPESFHIVFDREEDGRWIAEIPELPGVMVYGATKHDAEVAVNALALRVLADRAEKSKKPVKSIRFCESNVHGRVRIRYFPAALY